MSTSIQLFLDHLTHIRRASPHTIRNYRNDLQQLAHFIDPETPESFLEKCTKPLIRRFIVDLQSNDVSKRSVARKLSSFRSFFRFCHRQKMLSCNPMADIDSPKVKIAIPGSLQYAQIELFFSLPDTSSFLGIRDKTIMELLYSSGLRVSELANLNKASIDKEEHIIKVRGKGKKERFVPYTEQAGYWIQTYLEHPERTCDTKAHSKEIDHEALFLNKWGKRLSTRSIDRLFAEYLQKSGLSSNITPHIIRHTIATHWLENGMDLKTIQTLLGHASMATTTIYTEVSSELKQKTVKKFHPRA